jgi:hypothetical protein
VTFFLKKPQPTRQEVATEVRQAIAGNLETDKLVESHHGPDTQPMQTHTPDESIEDLVEATDTADRITGGSKLSKLVADDFPFDESQLAAIEGMLREPYACMTGAAGTGKTTSTKKFVDRLLETVSLNEVDMTGYWKKGSSAADSDDEYDMPENWIPAVCMVSFTGRATQMIKKNFPRDWHGNIMTIHRCLGFYPEPYEDWDEESQQHVTKRRFVPTYTADLLLPWDVIIIDEAGMLGLDLWHQLYAAMKPGCRVYMIGDINQLPPVHGKPIFGFALAKWPAWELTHVHRQQGVNNPIVDNAWRILNGRQPVSEGRFQMLELADPKTKRADDATTASRRVRALVPAFQKKGIYDPIRDTIITPINGEDGARGFALGQLPLNREFALIFNPQSENPRYVIDAGREHKQFAVGDKVMATKNDWEAGITNGMTGIITDITEHAGYAGSRNRFGKVEDVKAYMEAEGESMDHVEFSLEELNDSYEAIDQGMKDKKEKRERGPSSHIVTVRFGDGDHGFEIPFASLSEVGSLMTAYAVTCHKMQGGESPTIVIILHDAHKSMLYREWFYTAVTRASEKCIVLYTKDALRTALAKQNIKGSTLKEKVESFNRLIDPKGIMGAAMKVRMPEATGTSLTVLDKPAVVQAAAAHMTTQAEREGGLAQLLAKSKARKVEPQGERVIHHHHFHTQTIVVEKETQHEAKQSDPVDGGYAIRVEPEGKSDRLGADLADDSRHLGVRDLHVLPDLRPELTSQWGAYHMLQRIEADRGQLLLADHNFRGIQNNAPVKKTSPELEAALRAISGPRPAPIPTKFSWMKPKEN